MGKAALSPASRAADNYIWDQAHAILSQQYRAREVQTRTKIEALLRGTGARIGRWR